MNNKKLFSGSCNWKILIAYIVICVMIMPATRCCAENNILITPQPQELTTKNYDVPIIKGWWLTVDKNNKENLFSARYLEHQLMSKFNFNLPIEKTTFIDKEKRIILGTVEDSVVRETIKRLKIHIPETIGQEGYILEVFDDCIVIVGNEAAGVFYGVQTLLQLVKKKDNNIVVPAVKITDYPTTKNRGVHILDMDFNKIKAQLDQIAQLKMNVAIIQSANYFKLNKRDNQRKFREIFSYARDRHIEPIPEVTSFSVGQFVLTEDPHAAEGIWVIDEHFKFVNDEAEPLNPTKHSLVNVIRSEDSNVCVKCLDKTKTYKEGIDYKIVEGDIAYPFSLGKQPTKIIRIPDGSIKSGAEVLISYDYVERMCSYAVWSVPYCPSSERTYKIMFRTLRDVIQILHPRYISIGHDEIRGLNRDSRCRKRNLSNAELMADEINRLNDSVKDIDPDVRLLMWDDMLNPWHNGGDENYQVQFGGLPGKTAPALDLISEDIVLIIWWSDKKDWLEKMKRSPDYFEAKGFEYLVSGSSDMKNIENWIKIIRDRKKGLGIIIASWKGFENNIEAIKFAAEHSWTE